MPHVTVDYSSRLGGVLAGTSFVAELHQLVLDVSRSEGVCKVFLRAAAETYIGGGEGDRHTALVHVGIGLLPGRPDSLKDQLSERVLALLRRYLPRDPGGTGTVCTVEVRDLSPSYRLSREAPAVAPHREEPGRHPSAAR
ncbi:5-carboxymethyl-2-hydroxymuconate delta isomerase [Streptomyces luomodiensis]|uniref:5-carboxymethyl-2-hydroxymuconate delta isomerase n=1 Tax=Streptomyces luomodiensis TaxID=3026192 RepID=A0ABY9UPU6_9ACTN|nr:5-carboxymethyl-2-hydroxymuconate delta isomerase [Streptomyces sp. SCA4-21]WNE94271.1 5-carboxymethyl-2-hydroxymuconate delta isomerase [Streptomyces sp. SCA4-21]